MNKKQIPNILSITRLFLLLMFIPLYLYQYNILSLIIIIIIGIINIIDIIIINKLNILSHLSIRFIFYSILLILIFKHNYLIPYLLLELILDIIKIIYKNNNIVKHNSLIEYTKSIIIYLIILLSIINIYNQLLFIIGIIFILFNFISYFLHYLYMTNVIEKHILGYKLFKLILTPIFNSYYNPRVINKEVIPLEGPVILAGNHRHLFDQCLCIPATKRMVHYMAKKEYFDSIKTRWFFEMAGCICVNRNIKDEHAKKEAIEVLNNNGVIGIFPEGTRNKTSEDLLPFKYGTVSLAKKTNATIVPFAIRGSYVKHSKDLVIEFGKPFKVDDDLKKANIKLEKIIKELYLKK